MEVDMEIVKEIEKINFFERCGIRDKLELNHNCRMIRSLDKIDDHYLKFKWGNRCLDEFNDMWSFFHNKYRFHNLSMVQEWNPLAKKIREETMQPINEIIDAKAANTCFANREYFIRCIKSDVLSIILYYSLCFSGVIDGYKSEFYEDQLLIFKAGHLSCGWMGSNEYGKFLVF